MKRFMSMSFRPCSSLAIVRTASMLMRTAKSIQRAIIFVPKHERTTCCSSLPSSTFTGLLHNIILRFPFSNANMWGNSPKLLFAPHNDILERHTIALNDDRWMDVLFEKRFGTSHHLCAHNQI
jgi:hypothetical protein